MRRFELSNLGGPRRWLFGGAAVSLLAVAGVARAQDSSTLSTLIVTATKRDTQLLQTPMSIFVVTSQTLSDTRADDFSDLAKLVPGLSFTDSGPGQKRYALRGLQSAGDPEVALYYDDIPVSGLPGGSLDTGDDQPDFKLVDVDRIEVLEGPQGTLYGAGAMGGAIRIISKKPVLGALGGDLEAGGGFTEGGSPSWRTDATANIPLLADRLAIRLVGYYRDNGGWIDDVPAPGIAVRQIDQNNLNWEKTLGGRASLLFQAASNWTITGVAYIQSTRTGDSFATYPAFATQDDRYVSKAFVRTPWIDNAQLYELKSDYDFSWASFNTTVSYQHRDADLSLDTTRYLLSVFGCTIYTPSVDCPGSGSTPAVSFTREQVAAWSGEARLTSKGSGPLQWVLGTFIQDSSTALEVQVAKANAAGAIQLASNGVADNRLFARKNNDTFDQYAVFGEVSYELAPRLKATVGLRWFESDRSDQQDIVQQFFPSAPTGEEPFQHFRQSDIYKKFELSYSVTSNMLVYTQAAQGFRSGGPNYPGGFTTNAPPYQADSVWDYEVGAKVSAYQQKLYWTATAFKIDWSNIQELVPTTLFNYIANAGRAESDGFETQLNAQPVSGMVLSGGLTYNYARLVGAQPTSSSALLQLSSGDKLANVPDWTAVASLGYSHSLIPGYTGSIRFDGSYKSDMHSLVTPQNRADFLIKSSVLFDVHLNIDTDQQWRLGLDVENLFNRFAPISGKPLDSNLAESITAARPRTVELSVRRSF